MGSSALVPSDYLCPWCGAPLSDTGDSQEPSDKRGPVRPILLCQWCGASLEGPPRPHALTAGWKGVVLAALFGIVLVGLSLGLPNGAVVIGMSHVLPHGFALLIGALGVVLCALAAFALRDLLHGRRQVRYWQQNRRAH
jgi:hypothetical protein